MKSAVGKTGEFAGAGIYRGSYGVVFGAIFKELLPIGNALRRGFQDGSEAAIDAAGARKAPPRSGETPQPAKAKSARKSAA